MMANRDCASEHSAEPLDYLAAVAAGSEKVHVDADRLLF